MGRMLCPVMVGRDAQLAALTEHLEAVSAGRGRVVAIVGEPGLGKSRLGREALRAAEGRDLRVLSGRAVPGSSPTPLRPFTEAMLVAERGGWLPDSPELAGFAGQVARLIPRGGAPDGQVADSSPLLMSEAVVRLLRVAAGQTACVLYLEDLHWADPETLAVVEYLADTLAGERVLCLLTARDEPGRAADLLERLRARGGVDIVRLDPLPITEQAEMVAACLNDAVLAADVGGFVTAHSDGVPFLVEELLAGLVSSGALGHTELGWQVVGRLTPSVPISFAETVRARMIRLGATGRQVLGAAAVLGRRFDWELLPGVAGQDGATTVEAMRAAIAEQLVLVDGSEFRFRHALTREAVLAEVLPPERAEFSRRAIDGVRRAHPGLPGAWCELAAELAEAADDLAAAAELLAQSARRSVQRGAFTSAAATAERAIQLAGDRSDVAATAGEVWVEALVSSGDAAQAEQVGAGVLAQLERSDGPARTAVAVHLVLARAAIAAGDSAGAQGHVDDARALPLDADERIAMTARLDAVTAHVALDAERLGEARALASAALAPARAAGLPEVECEALEVLGRLSGDIDESIALFERAGAIAQRHGLVAWQMRALQETVLRKTDAEGAAPLVEARRVAAEAGSLIVVAQLDLIIAEIAFSAFDCDGALDAAQRCVHASRRFGLATLPVALLWLAGVHALRGDEVPMEAVLAQAREIDPADERIAADSWGRVRATLRIVREDRSGLKACLDASMPHVRAAPPSRSMFLGRMLWVVLHAMDDADLGAAARAEYAAADPLMSYTGGRFALSCAEAIALGRNGRPAEAERTYRAARETMAAAPAGSLMGGYLDRLVAEAAIGDGWGEPGAWLREVEAWYAANGYERIARGCRSLMLAAGSPAPRRGRGGSVVPAALRALGVTSREMDVLTLVVEGLGNREIAERLHLSTRTVEHHVASLLRRTGSTTRGELGSRQIG